MKINRCAIALVIFFTCTVINAQPLVQVERVPDGGIQPRLIQGQDGDIHLIYFRRHDLNGKKRTGDLYYTQRITGTDNWQPHVKVSSSSFNHLGPVSKASAVIDGEGRLHVVWFIPSAGGYRYSRSNKERTSFEPERSPVNTFTEGLDAEASISTYNSIVTITWHAGDLSDEASRSVYTLTSLDSGKTFRNATEVGDPTLGACACCSLASQYTKDGELQIAYRSAIENDGRHMQFLPLGRGTSLRTVGEWNINACPVSSNHLMGDWLAFELQGRLWTIDLSLSENAKPVRHAEVRQKHPTLAVNHRGDRLLVWGEAPGYFDGGNLKMEMYNANNKIIETPDHSSKSVAQFSVAAAIAVSDDEFLILY